MQPPRDIHQIFNKFAGREIEMIETVRTARIGGKDQPRTVVRLADPQNPIIADIRASMRMSKKARMANTASRTDFISGNFYLNAVTSTSSSAQATIPIPALTSVSSRCPTMR